MNAGVVSRQTTVAEVTARPEFGDWGQLLFPVGSGYAPSGSTRLADLRLAWYHGIRPEKTVEIVNRLLGDVRAGGQVFHDIYTDAEKAADPSLRDTGLVYFRPEGSRGAGLAAKPAPFGIWSAGGGMMYVGAMHDSLPQALELSRHGCAGFAVIYRPGWDTAFADLARAIQFVFEHAEELGVDTDGYLLGGGSAGARMAACLGSWGPAAYGAAELPRPACVVMQYTGHAEYNATGEPATFVTVGTSDHIASWQTMQARVEALDALGTPTELHVYGGLPHGFGLGTRARRPRAGWNRPSRFGRRTEMSNRPQVILHILQSIDGRVAGGFFGSAYGLVGEYGNIRRTFGADAVLYGATTARELLAHGHADLTPYAGASVPDGDFAAERAGFVFAIVDPEGTLGFSSAHGSRGDMEGHIVQLLREDVDPRYLAYLRDIGVSYVLAGRGGFDATLALERLGELFGTRKALLMGAALPTAPLRPRTSSTSCPS